MTKKGLKSFPKDATTETTKLKSNLGKPNQRNRTVNLNFMVGKALCNKKSFTSYFKAFHFNVVRKLNPFEAENPTL